MNVHVASAMMPISRRLNGSPRLSYLPKFSLRAWLRTYRTY